MHPIILRRQLCDSDLVKYACTQFRQATSASVWGFLSGPDVLTPKQLHTWSKKYTFQTDFIWTPYHPNPNSAVSSCADSWLSLQAHGVVPYKLSPQEAGGTTDVSCCEYSWEETPFLLGDHVEKLPGAAMVELPCKGSDTLEPIPPTSAHWWGASPPNSTFTDSTLVAWSHSWRKYLHHGNGHTLQFGTFVCPREPMANIYQPPCVKGRCWQTTRQIGIRVEWALSPCLFPSQKGQGQHLSPEQWRDPVGNAHWHWQNFCSEFDEKRDWGTVIFQGT